MSDNAIENMRSCWRHCADEILNDLVLGRCLSNGSMEGSVITQSSEFLIRRLLCDIQAVGWIFDRLCHMANSINDSCTAVLSLCEDCFAIEGDTKEEKRDNSNCDIGQFDVFYAWKWYTLIPFRGSHVTNSNSSVKFKEGPRNILSVDFDTIKEFFREYRDITFRYTTLLFQETDEQLGHDEFVTEACSILVLLAEFCYKWTVAQPDRTEGNMTLRSSLGLKDSFTTALANNTERGSKMSILKTPNSSPNLPSSATVADSELRFTPQMSSSMKWDSKKFLLAWAIDRYCLRYL